MFFPPKNMQLIHIVEFKVVVTFRIINVFSNCSSVSKRLGTSALPVSTQYNGASFETEDYAVNHSSNQNYKLCDLNRWISTDRGSHGRGGGSTPRINFKGNCKSPPIQIWQIIGPCIFCACVVFLCLALKVDYF